MSIQPSAEAAAPSPKDPGAPQPRWPLPVVAGLALAGLLSPLICFAGSAMAYALADQEQGTILAGAGLAHLLIGMTFLTGA